MQKARLKFNNKVASNNFLFVHHSPVSDGIDGDSDGEIYFAFFDNSEVALYSQKSKFFAKMHTDDLERLIDDGSVQIIP